jgi:thioredoxin 1
VSPRRRTVGALLVGVSLFGLAVHAAEPAYNETADAKAEVRQALADASQAKVPVLVVFGANWCGDCKVLDAALKSGPSAALVAREFRIVKVDVGRFDRNLDVAKAYDVPLKNGIPAVVVLSPAGQVRYATRAGELADARAMGESGIYDFFKKMADTGVRQNQ